MMDTGQEEPRTRAGRELLRRLSQRTGAAPGTDGLGDASDILAIEREAADPEAGMPIQFVAWITPEDIAKVHPYQMVAALEWGKPAPTGYCEVQVTLIDHGEWHAEQDRAMAELVPHKES